MILFSFLQDSEFRSTHNIEFRNTTQTVELQKVITSSRIIPHLPDLPLWTLFILFAIIFFVPSLLLDSVNLRHHDYASNLEYAVLTSISDSMIFRRHIYDYSFHFLHIT